MSLDEPSWDHRTFSANRDRLLGQDVARQFFDAVVSQASRAGILSDEHFTVDGTLMEAWASLKSVKSTTPASPAADPRAGWADDAARRLLDRRGA
jgi:transposase, IS4 family